MPGNQAPPCNPRSLTHTFLLNRTHTRKLPDIRDLLQGTQVRNPDYMAPSSRNYWIITMLIINMILWSVLCVGFMITFAATVHPFALMFSAAFGVGAWWMKRLMLEFHADLDHTKPPRLFRKHRRHVEDE